MKAGYKHHADAIAEYRELRHMTDRGAAAALGVSEKAVKTYRGKFREEIGRVVGNTSEVTSWQKMVPMAAGGVRIVTVSLSGPPKREEIP